MFCEKPLSLDRATTVATIEAVEAAGVPLQVGFHRRFDPDWAAAAARIAAGELGEVTLFRTSLRDMTPPDPNFLSASGGFFVDVTVHDLDVARWLVGEVVEVTAHGAASDPAFAELGDIDTAVCVLRFANGALGVIDNSRSARYGYECSTEVMGTLATVRVEAPRPVEWRTPGQAGYPLAAGLRRALPGRLRRRAGRVRPLRAGRHPTAGDRPRRARRVRPGRRRDGVLAHRHHRDREGERMNRIAGAPISWGVCEVPGWGYQLPPARVLAEMQEVGLAATELGPDGFLPAAPAAMADVLAEHHLQAVGGFTPTLLHAPGHDPVPGVRQLLSDLRRDGFDVLVLSADSGQTGYDSRPELDENGWATLLGNLDRSPPSRASTV